MKLILNVFISFAFIWASPCAIGFLPSRARDETSQAQLLQRIIDVLHTTAADAKNWDDKAAAARAQAQVADLIWVRTARRRLNI